MKTQFIISSHPTSIANQNPLLIPCSRYSHSLLWTPGLEALELCGLNPLFLFNHQVPMLPLPLQNLSLSLLTGIFLLPVPPPRPPSPKPRFLHGSLLHSKSFELLGQINLSEVLLFIMSLNYPNTFRVTSFPFTLSPNSSASFQPSELLLMLCFFLATHISSLITIHNSL